MDEDNNIIQEYAKDIIQQAKSTKVILNTFNTRV